MFANLKELVQSMPPEEVCREYLAKQRCLMERQYVLIVTVVSVM